MQSFWEIDRLKKENPWNMNGLHSHTHFEIYYLIEGCREYFFSNTTYHIEAPCIIIIPPHVMHMTEGGPFSRYNIDIASEYLNEFQREILLEKSKKILKPDVISNKELLRLFSEMEKVDRTQKNADKIVDALFSYCLLQINKLEDHMTDNVSFENNYIPPLVLKTVNYLNNTYGENHSLCALAERFYVSKATLVYNFNKYLHCTPMDFLLTLRLNKAKEELVNTNASIKEISDKCGFSSPNYFSLIFKRKEHISPANYRKYRETKK